MLPPSPPELYPAFPLASPPQAGSSKSTSPGVPPTPRGGRSGPGLVFLRLLPAAGLSGAALRGQRFISQSLSPHLGAGTAPTAREASGRRGKGCSPGETLRAGCTKTGTSNATKRASPRPPRGTNRPYAACPASDAAEALRRAQRNPARLPRPTPTTLGGSTSKTAKRWPAPGASSPRSSRPPSYPH